MQLRRPRKRTGPATNAAETAASVLRKLGGRQPGIHPEIWSRWTEIVGPDLARRTLPSGIRGKTLLLAVKSSAWLQEMTFLKARLLERLSDEIGPGVITDIRLVLDPELPVQLSPPQQQPAAEVSDKPLPPEIAAAADAVTDDDLREAIRRAARANL